MTTATFSLPILADAILYDIEWRALTLSSADSVQIYTEHGYSADISDEDAERVRVACASYLSAEDKSSNVFFHLITEPLSD